MKMQDIHIESIQPIPAPSDMAKELPQSEKSESLIAKSRTQLMDIISGKDKRTVVITGPCSIHDTKAALEYAERLSELKKQVDSSLMIIMRVYFEKPRTTIGWKGLINDPHLDGSCDIAEGLKQARMLLNQISEMGLPIATELLDPIVPQYIGNFISWAAIGARTTESQTHREMASGLSMPVGFKNGTDGNVQIAIDAMESAKHPHSFLGINMEGKISLVKTQGNPYGHMVLRGGKGKPNYGPESINMAQEQLKKAGLSPAVMIDCSHANSNKVHGNQKLVWESVVKQIKSGNDNILGLMLESHLFEGNQPFNNSQNLKYGVSITDACISWQDTESLIFQAAESLESQTAAIAG